jgi:hypothetical protein
MRADDPRNPDLVTSSRHHGLWHSQHFDLPILRRRPQPGRHMLLCVRCFVIALVVATVATVVLKTVRG